MVGGLSCVRVVTGVTFGLVLVASRQSPVTSRLPVKTPQQHSQNQSRKNAKTPASKCRCAHRPTLTHVQLYPCLTSSDRYHTRTAVVCVRVFVCVCVPRVPKDEHVAVNIFAASNSTWPAALHWGSPQEGLLRDHSHRQCAEHHLGTRCGLPTQELLYAGYPLRPHPLLKPKVQQHRQPPREQACRQVTCLPSLSCSLSRESTSSTKLKAIRCPKESPKAPMMPRRLLLMPRLQVPMRR
jgi:hypothetical protein